MQWIDLSLLSNQQLIKVYIYKIFLGEGRERENTTSTWPIPPPSSSNPIQSNPIQSNPIKYRSNNNIQHTLVCHAVSMISLNSDQLGCCIRLWCYTAYIACQPHTSPQTNNPLRSARYKTGIRFSLWSICLLTKRQKTVWNTYTSCIDSLIKKPPPPRNWTAGSCSSFLPLRNKPIIYIIHSSLSMIKIHFNFNLPIPIQINKLTN